MNSTRRSAAAAAAWRLWRVRRREQRRNRGSAASSGQYNNNGTVGTATISVDPVTHNIVVIADKQTSEQIRQVIASLDAPEPQVLIKVVFVEVQHNKASDIGVQGAYTGHNGNFSQITGYVTNSFLITTNVTTTASGGMTVTPTFTPVPSPLYQCFNVGNNFGLPQSLAGAAGNGGMYQILGNDFTATLQAIAAAGKAQMLSRPSILARDGQMAEIVVGQSIYLPSGVSLHLGRRHRHHRSDHQRHLSERRHPTGRHAVHRGEQPGANDSPAANHVH